MKIQTPEYYRQFHCIAADCPDSCCKEWEVDVDPDTARFYRSLSGDLGDRLRQVLKDTGDGTVMTIQDGRCPMWRRDGLCRIQAELGHEALCQTCRDFPRLRHDYGDFVEFGLELSCPEAARLILTQPETIRVSTADGGEEPEYDPDMMQILLQSRETALEFLLSTGLPVNRVLSVLLLYGHSVQNWLDGGEPARLDPEGSLALAGQYAAPGNWELFTSFFARLEILTPQWQQRLQSPAPGSWDPRTRALACYFIRRYWLQAVSDYDLISRIKLAVSGCLLINHLGGDFVQTAQLFSKEIENDPDNLESLLDGAYTAPALTDLQLLQLLSC